MDAFYAAVEQRDFPELRGKAIAVGGNRHRGVVSTASYEARKFGVRSAMPNRKAFSLCPHIIFVSHRFEVYKSVSKQIMNIFYEFTDLVEPLSLDEAFLDVTENKKNNPSATLLAKQIRERIKQETKLTASAGISFNKFLAKVASDYNKPDGMFCIPPKKAQVFIDDLPVGKFFGVGKVTQAKMYKMNIFTGKDLKELSKLELIKNFGKAGTFYYDIVRCIDNREVISHRERKSIGTEDTFAEDLSDPDELFNHIEKIAERVLERMKKQNKFGYTLTLKVKYADFTQITRSKTISEKINNLEIMRNLAFELWKNVDFETKKIRLLGLTVSNIPEENKRAWIQLKLNLK